MWTKPGKLVLASGNAGKLADFQALFRERIEVAAQDDLGVIEIPETGKTFVENALLKARNCALQTGLPALADDSGLVVEALQGAPGIYSARYAGPTATAAANIELLLTNMATIPDSRRQAHFYCVLVLLRAAEDPMPLLTQGVWSGQIARTAAGSAGFGYDPIFVPAGLNVTAAKLTAEQKNRRSHRGQATRALLARLDAIHR